jgi:type II secretory pathway pseudopilin PulG
MFTIVLFTLMVILAVYLLFEVQREKRRNRILQSFTAGIIKSVSDYVSQTDALDISSAADIVKVCDKKFPIPYSKILQNISKEFEKDFWTSPYWKWIKKDRNLFYERKYANDGFNMIYWDLFDKALADLRNETEKEKGIDKEQPSCQKSIPPN